MIGKQLDQYTIVAKLGSGSVGEVYEATGPEGNSVAIKLVDPQLAARPDFTDRFVQLAGIIRQRLVNQPAVGQVYDVQQAGDDLYLVMEYLPDGTLEAYRQKLAMRDERFIPEQIVAIGIQVADILRLAANAGVPAHGGLHPRNMLLRLSALDDERVAAQIVLTDFGQTHLVHQVTAADAKSYHVPVPYAAPALLASHLEQTPDADERADVYALGVLLYFLLNGKHYVEAPEPAPAPTESRERPEPEPGAASDPRRAIEDLALEAIHVYAHGPATVRATVAGLANEFRAIAGQQGWSGELRLAAVDPLPDDVSQADRQPHTEGRQSQEVSDVVARIEIVYYPETNDHGPPADISQGISKSLYEINREQVIISIGRDRRCDISLVHDDSIQPHHLDIEHTIDGWRVINRAGESPVRLEESTLLPDAPQPWHHGQTVHAGRYTLRLLSDSDTRPHDHRFGVELLPRIQEISPGFQGKVGISIRNHSERGHFRVRIEQLPVAWYSLPQDGLVLNRGDQREVTLMLRPPLDARGEDHHYTVVVWRLSDDPEHTVYEYRDGILRVQPTLPFTSNLITDRAENTGRYRLLIYNHGNQPVRYAINGRSQTNALRFGVAGVEQEEIAEPEVAPEETATSRAGRRLPGQEARGAWQNLRRLPGASRLIQRSEPLQQAGRARQDAAMVQRRARPVTDAGRRLRQGKGEPSAAPDSDHDQRETHFAGELQHEIKVTGGDAAIVYFDVLPRQRPFHWQPAQAYPFEVKVTPLGHTATDGSPQTHTAALHVTSRLSQALWLLLLGLLLLLCAVSTIATAFLANQSLGAVRVAQAAGATTAADDSDGDGIPSLVEVEQYGTDPFNADTDGDGIPDGIEINLPGFDPLRPDSNGNGVPDGVEAGFVTLTPAPPAGIAYPTAVPPPTSTPIPTITPTPIPAPLPEATVISIRSIAGAAEGQTIAIGDTAQNNPITQTLSFDTSTIPANVIVDDAWLVLVLANGSPPADLETRLGRIYVTVAQDHAGLEKGETAGYVAELLMLQPPDNVMVATLDPRAVNLAGATQVELHFELSSNLDNQPDELRFYSSNPPPGQHPPQLYVRYRPAATDR